MEIKASPWIMETTAATFEKDVIERSMEVPVVIDFWATWCGPCQELGPILENLAREYAGRFLLVKVDVDQAPELAGAFGVQSIPHVFALKGGQAVNQFLGNLPEGQIRVWLDNLMPSPFEALMQAGSQLEAAQPSEAEAKYREAIALQPHESPAKIALSRVLLAQHRDEDSRAIITELKTRGYLEPEAENIVAELDLRAAAAESGGVGAAREAATADPQNRQLQLQLADALAAAHQYPEAMELCLSLVVQDKTGTGEAAKQTMVKMFQVLGNQSELVQAYRRKLSTALY